jgi:hypothetical protein
MYERDNHAMNYSVTNSGNFRAFFRGLAGPDAAGAPSRPTTAFIKSHQYLLLIKQITALKSNRGIELAAQNRAPDANYTNAGRHLINNRIGRSAQRLCTSEVKFQRIKHAHQDLGELHKNAYEQSDSFNFGSLRYVVK